MYYIEMYTVSKILISRQKGYGGKIENQERNINHNIYSNISIQNPILYKLLRTSKELSISYTRISFNSNCIKNLNIQIRYETPCTIDFRLRNFLLVLERENSLLDFCFEFSYFLLRISTS